MKIVVTGGTGLIGNALGQVLVRQGHEVHILVRDVKTAPTRLAYPCKLWPWPSDGVVPVVALTGADVVVHLAGENVATKRWTPARKKALRDSRIETARQLAAALTSPLKAFISASGVGYYGDRGDEVLKETSSAGDDFLAQLCQEWESGSRQVPAARHAQLRFGVVLSPLGGFLSEVVPLFRALGASRLGDGKQYFSWIHVDDLVQALVKAITDPSIAGAYNVVAPDPLTNAELTRQLGQVLRTFTGPPAPKFALKLLYGELTVALLGSQRAVPERLIQAGFEFKYPDLRGALNVIYPALEPGEMSSQFELWVPAPADAVWEFFSSEKNLERITPPMLQFKVKSISTPQIESGTLIDYQLKIHGVPAAWRTRIGMWQPPNKFSDEQLKGPYAKWHHVHEFEKLGDGMLLRDTVRWRLPMGLAGRIVALPMVLKDVGNIFKYRSEVIGSIFRPR